MHHTSIGKVSKDLHKLNSIVTLCAFERLVELGLHEIPDRIILVLAFAERVAAVGRVVNTDVLNLTSSSGDKRRWEKNGEKR